MKKRFSEEQIISFLREAEAGVAVKDLCRRHGFSEASYYLWRSKFGGMSVPEGNRIKELEAEDTRLKKLLAEQMFENDVIKDALRKNVVNAPARRMLVRQLMERGLTERRALAMVRMSASALRYVPRPDRNVELRERQPLLRLGAANQVWSMNLVFDRTAEGRVLKALTIIDDATHEAVAIEVERAISAHGVARVLDRLALHGV